MHGHRRKGGRLIAPMNQIKVVQYLSWREEILPELMWIGMAIGAREQYYEEVLAEIKDLTRWMEDRHEQGKAPCIVLASEWDRVGADDKAAIQGEVKKGRWKRLSGGATRMRKKFGPGLTDCLAREGLATPSTEEVLKEWEEMAGTMLKGMRKQTRLSVFLRGMIVTWEIEADRAEFTWDGVESWPEEMAAALEDPTTPEGERGAATIRALAMASFGTLAQRTRNREWARQFWKTCRKQTPCIFRETNMEPAWNDEAWQAFNKVQKKAMALAHAATQYVEELMQMGNREEENDYRSVAEALVGRAGSLFASLALSPMSWTGTTAPMTLRAMVEAYIDLKYIAGEPETRAGKYVEHGLGLEKLAAHHSERTAKDERDAVLKRLLERRIEIADEIIGYRQADWATDVTTGDWAGNSVRARADAAGLMDLYNGAYQPWSAASHNAWSHLAHCNSEMCFNPLHLPHGRGRIRLFYEDWNPDYMFRACKYLERVTDLFDQEFNCGSGGRRLRKAFLEIVEKHWGEWLPPVEKEDI